MFRQLASIEHICVEVCASLLWAFISILTLGQALRKSFLRTRPGQVTTIFRFPRARAPRKRTNTDRVGTAQGMLTRALEIREIQAIVDRSDQVCDNIDID